MEYNGDINDFGEIRKIQTYYGDKDCIPNIFLSSPWKIVTHNIDEKSMTVVYLNTDTNENLFQELIYIPGREGPILTEPLVLK